MWNSFEYDITNIFTGNISFVIKRALQNDAHLAGGFVNKFIQHKMSNGVDTLHMPSDWWHKICAYFRKDGDIDIFFETEDSFKQTIATLGSLNVPLNKEQLLNTDNVATFEIDLIDSLPLIPNYVIPKHSSQYRPMIKLQLILSNMNARTNVQTFDMTNSMCYVEKNSVHYTDRWAELRSSNTLEVVNWSKPLKTIKRIAKYSQKHGYDKLTQKTEDELVTQAFNVLEDIKKSPKQLHHR